MAVRSTSALSATDDAGAAPHLLRLLPPLLVRVHVAAELCSVQHLAELQGMWTAWGFFVAKLFTGSL